MSGSELRDGRAGSMTTAFEAIGPRCRIPLLEATDRVSPPLLELGKRLLTCREHVLPCCLVCAADVLGHLARFLGFRLHLFHRFLVVGAGFLTHLLEALPIVVDLRFP